MPQLFCDGVISDRFYAAGDEISLPADEFSEVPAPDDCEGLLAEVPEDSCVPPVSEPEVHSELPAEEADEASPDEAPSDEAIEEPAELPLDEPEAAPDEPSEELSDEPSLAPSDEASLAPSVNASNAASVLPPDEASIADSSSPGRDKKDRVSGTFTSALSGILYISYSLYFITDAVASPER